MGMLTGIKCGAALACLFVLATCGGGSSAIGNSGGSPLPVGSATIAFTSSAGVTLNEAAASHSVSLTLTVVGGGTLAAAVSVTVSNAGTGTATSGTDYTAFAPQVITFIAGSITGTTQTVAIAVLADLVVEGNETVVLSLSGQSGATLGAQTTHTATITDDDGSAGGPGGASPLAFDFNGDGFDDTIIGATHDDDGGTDAGCAFIFFGSASPAAAVSATAANVKLVGGDASDWFGCSVASAGDFNNDGFDDVVVGAWQDEDGGSIAGSAYIFFGSATPAAVIDCSAANVHLVGDSAFDYFGVSVAGAGDVNGDGIADVIVGADGYLNKIGRAYVFLGEASPPATIDATVADITYTGTATNTWFGHSVDGAGDFNGDGYADLIVGAMLTNDGGSRSGSAFIFYGSGSPSAAVSATVAPVKLIGEKSDAWMGNSVAGIGDFNNDGFDDVAVGAPNDDMIADPGKTLIFFGTANPAAATNATAANVILSGEGNYDRFGFGVGRSGDINGDGFDDILVGAYYDDDGGTSSGCAFVFFGSASPAATINGAAANMKLVGESTTNYFGRSVGSSGDINSDGKADIVIGAHGNGAGTAYIFLGTASPSSNIDASTASVKLSGASAGDYFGFAAE